MRQAIVASVAELFRLCPQGGVDFFHQKVLRGVIGGLADGMADVLGAVGASDLIVKRSAQQRIQRPVGHFQKAFRSSFPTASVTADFIKPNYEGPHTFLGS